MNKSFYKNGKLIQLYQRSYWLNDCISCICNCLFATQKTDTWDEKPTYHDDISSWSETQSYKDNTGWMITKDVDNANKSLEESLKSLKLYCPKHE